MKRATDFISKPFDCANVKKTDEILGQDFELKECQFREGQFGEYASMFCKMISDNTEFVVNCGGGVIITKLKEVMKNTQLPVLLNLHKPAGAKYYDIA